MGKFKNACISLILYLGITANAQIKYEQEHRIPQSAFPEPAVELLGETLKDARRIRFYRETDSASTGFEVKFRKDRLHYSVEFGREGALEDIEILIGEVDIPNESMQRIRDYLQRTFRKYRIRKIQQQYPVTPGLDPESTVKNAFQNLLIPEINYEIVVSGKQGNTFREFEILFNAEGEFRQLRKSVRQNYDHVLY